MRRYQHILRTTARRYSNSRPLQATTKLCTDITDNTFTVAGSNGLKSSFIETINDSMMNFITYNAAAHPFLQDAISIDEDCAIAHLLLIFENLRNGGSSDKLGNSKHFSKLSDLLSKGTSIDSVCSMRKA